MKTISIDAVVTEIFKAEMCWKMPTFSKVALDYHQLYLELLAYHAKIA